MRPLSFRLQYAEPDVTWSTIGLLGFVALIVGSAAYLTRRTVRRDRSSLPHHQAVNRLVLGKAVALVGALFTGGYLGYALAQVGAAEPAADSRLWHSLVAAGVSVLVGAAALFLEHACRVPPED